jgi:hypothetical protein
MRKVFLDKPIDIIHLYLSFV